jgi:hypothetical protein
MICEVSRNIQTPQQGQILPLFADSLRIFSSCKLFIHLLYLMEQRQERSWWVTQPQYPAVTMGTVKIRCLQCT